MTGASKAAARRLNLSGSKPFAYRGASDGELGIRTLQKVVKRITFLPFRPPDGSIHMKA